MAIDGMIAMATPGYDTEKGEPTVDLFLVERIEGSIPGQPTLRILSPTWTPEVGMTIWGGSAVVFISWPDVGGSFIYDRVGYTRLRERGKGR